MNKIFTEKIVILSEPIHSGTSAALEEWVKEKDVSGFTNPTLEGLKLLKDVKKNICYGYQAEEEAPKTIAVGRYFLYSEAFVTAREIFKAALLHPTDWLLLDEIGKLELKGEGHHSLLVEAFSLWKNKLLLVVRNTLLEDVVNAYGITNPLIINKTILKNIV